MTAEEFEIIDQYHCPDCAPKAGPSSGRQILKRDPSFFVFCFGCLFVYFFAPTLLFDSLYREDCCQEIGWLANPELSTMNNHT